MLPLAAVPQHPYTFSDFTFSNVYNGASVKTKGHFNVDAETFYSLYRIM
jgi:hypothetical protein